MLHEQLALERKSLYEENNNLHAMLKAMESDFAQCARGVSACFFCENDETCNGCDKDCNFKWKHD